MMLWLFAMAVAIGAVAVSTLRLRRVRSALHGSPADRARAIGRGANAERVRRMAIEMREAGAIWEADLLDDIIVATSEAARVALANEHLGDLAARLEWGRHIPLAAARLSVTIPLCAVFFSLARGGLQWSSVLPAAACAGVGAAVSLWVGREADRTAAGLREGVDMLVERLLRAAATQDPQAGDSQ
jgi:hypothetical protein